MSKTKFQLFVCVLFVSIFISSCAVFERRYSELYLTEKVQDIQYFRFELGCHTIEDKKKLEKIDRDSAIVQLLKNELSMRGMCKNGYSVIEKKVYRHMDVTIYGKCIDNIT